MKEKLLEELKLCVLRSRLALGLPDLHNEVIDITASEICRLLDSGITVDNLDAVYVSAMQQKANSFPLNYVEFNSAYRAMSQQAKAAEVMTCPGCDLAKEEFDKPCRIHQYDKRHTTLGDQVIKIV